MREQLVYLNGIDGVTGDYLVPPLSLADVVAKAAGTPRDAPQASWLKQMVQAIRRPFLGLPLDVDPKVLSRAGWAVVFASDAAPEVRAALEPLIIHRRLRVPPDRCKLLAYKPGESVREWLRRYGASPGTVSPTRVPYYLMLVGKPASIPFEFQCLLDIEYAVGRLAFDRLEEYGQYIASVIAYETARTVPNAKEVVFWGPRHAADRATQMSADHLITPLSHGMPAAGDQPQEPPITETLGYRCRCLKDRDATKANLADVVHAHGAAIPPAMLFTASHGIGWPKGHHQQPSAQGALLCQDWPGFCCVRSSDYLTAADIDGDARLHGLVAFMFACYGAGTPAFDNFLIDRSQGPLSTAEQPFVAALPQRLLSHSQGGALAVIGHVDRAWGYSIQPPGVGPQLAPFRNLIGRILSGEPVGHATKDFSEKYAILSSALLSQMDQSQPGPKPSDEELAWTWVERNDAQNYIVLGDPAVRVRVELLK